MSDADINPCPSHDINVTVTGRGTPQPDNTCNDLLLRADIVAGYNMSLTNRIWFIHIHSLATPWTTLIMLAMYIIQLERSKRCVAVGSRITYARLIHTGVNHYSTRELMG